MSNFLTHKEILDLKLRHRKADRKTADKIKTILMLDQGYSFEEIARVLLADDSTIRRWHKVYESHGLEDLFKNHYVGGNLSKSQVKRSFGMSNSDICEFSKTLTTYELTIHNDQHMTPVGWRHSGCTVFVFDYQPFEVTFWEKLHNLCENIFADVHYCSNLCFAKEQNSKGRQGFDDLLYCA